MAINITLNNIATGFNLSKINQNFQIIKEALVDAVSRNADLPNTMENDFDLNGNDLLNGGDIKATRLFIGSDEFLPGSAQIRGYSGWSPILSILSDSSRRVMQLVGWTGGTGDTPTDYVGEYLGDSGYTPVLADATDIRGPQGASGPGSGDMLAAQNLADVGDAATAFDNIKQMATGSYKGVVELATFDEALNGTNLNAISATILKGIVDVICPVGTVQAFLGNNVPDYFGYSKWLPLNGTSIGNGASGATGRANDDTLALFTWLWSNTNVADIPIQTNTGSASTKGSDASSDFNAGKRLVLPDSRNRFFRSINTSSRGAGSAQGAQVGPHTHTGSTSYAGDHAHYLNLQYMGGYDGPAHPTWGNGDFANGYEQVWSNTGGGHTHSVTINSNGTDETRVANIGLLYCVKY